MTIEILGIIFLIIILILYLFTIYNIKDKFINFLLNDSSMNLEKFNNDNNKLDVFNENSVTDINALLQSYSHELPTDFLYDNNIRKKEGEELETYLSRRHMELVNNNIKFQDYLQNTNNIILNNLDIAMNDLDTFKLSKKAKLHYSKN